jgi:Family of unknown function (DUF6318)
MRRSAPSVLATALLVAATSAGCSSDPEPKFADPTSSEPTFSASGSPTESLGGSSTEPVTEEPSGPVVPEYPEAANGKDRAAAEAFARYYWQVLDYTDVSGETKLLRELSPTCTSCLQISDLVDRLYRNGTRIVGIERGLTITKTAVVNREDRIVASIDLSYRTNHHKVVLEDGTVTRKVPTTVAGFVIVTRPARGGTWRVDDLGTE